MQHRSVIRALNDAGYMSTSSFSQRFKESTGLSPTAYKRSIHTLHEFLKSAYSNNFQTVILYRNFDSQKFNQTIKPFSYLTYSSSKNSKSSSNIPFVSYFDQSISSKLHIKIRGQSQQAITFVGLYKKAIPEGPPVQGLALIGVEEASITVMPDDNYFVMACEVQLNTNPLHYFQLETAKRAIFRQPVQFLLQTSQAVELTLRDKLANDPPINVNLLQLLYESIS